MSNACVRAAATGLPQETAADFHLSLGREIARINVELARAEAEGTAMEATGHLGRLHLATASEHLEDREETLIKGLSTFPAISLAGATVQLAAAARIFTWITATDDPRPEEERAIRRLMASALRVMTDAAGLDPVSDGIADLASPAGDPWRDVYERIAEIFPAKADAAA